MPSQPYNQFNVGRGRPGPIPISPPASRPTHLGSGSALSRGGPSSASPTISRATQLGLGLGPSRGAGGGLFSRGGLGLGRGGTKRHMKVQKDSIKSISKNDIQRLARRGGVKRISQPVYDDIRSALRDRLAVLLKDICAIIDSSGRKTVAVTDVVYALRLRGLTIYGFDETR